VVSIALASIASIKSFLFFISLRNRTIPPSLLTSDGYAPISFLCFSLVKFSMSNQLPNCVALCSPPMQLWLILKHNYVLIFGFIYRRATYPPPPLGLPLASLTLGPIEGSTTSQVLSKTSPPPFFHFLLF
jgi:hypothetical protein